MQKLIPQLRSMEKSVQKVCFMESFTTEVKSHVGLNFYATFLQIFLGSEQRIVLPHCSSNQNLQGGLLVMGYVLKKKQKGEEGSGATVT